MNDWLISQHRPFLFWHPATLFTTCCINISWCKHWTLRTLSRMCCTEPSIHTLSTHYNPTGLLLARHFGFSSDTENCTNESVINILWDVCKSSIYWCQLCSRFSPRQMKLEMRETHIKNCIRTPWVRMHDFQLISKCTLSFTLLSNLCSMKGFVPSFKSLTSTYLRMRSRGHDDR